MLFIPFSILSLLHLPFFFSRSILFFCHSLFHSPFSLSLPPFSHFSLLYSFLTCLSTSFRCLSFSFIPHTSFFTLALFILCFSPFRLNFSIHTFFLLILCSTRRSNTRFNPFFLIFSFSFSFSSSPIRVNKKLTHSPCLFPYFLLFFLLFPSLSLVHHKLLCSCKYIKEINLV